MASDHDRFKELLRNQRQKITPARMSVFDALYGREPQTIQEIYSRCRGQADRSSVYRTIALLEQCGIIKRLQSGWKYKLELSDDFHHHHHHLTCLECGRTFPLKEDEELEKRLKKLAALNNFRITEHQIEMQGVCQNCAKAS